ncbi:MAG: TonB family protein [Terriglobales bacterium]
MPLRALLFSKDPETNAVLTDACQNAGLRLETCDDIFTAMEKGTKQGFAIILVDWASQPEAGFLVKRARESGPNKEFAAVAIVNRDPSATEMRENRLQFLIHRPVAAEEVRDVIAGALHKTQAGDAANASLAEAEPEPAEAATAAPSSSAVQSNEAEGQQGDGKFSFQWAEDRPNEGESANQSPDVPAPDVSTRNYGAIFRQVFTAALVLAAALLLMNGRDLIVGFVRSPEGKGRVLRESVAAYFHLEPPDAIPVIGAKPYAATATATDTAATPESSSVSAPQLQVVEAQPTIDDSQAQLRKAADFPLPSPQVDVAPPPQPRRAAIPDSIRSSAPIAPPVVVTVNPAQMMPVSSPSIPAPSSQTFSEPVSVSEETERSLLLRSVNPDYPADAVPQKLHGPVVLQATIGRDGSVEDLKIVRGYFVLGRAAIAAVKQWQFKPYTLNGKPARTQTQITINFEVPQS